MTASYSESAERIESPDLTLYGLSFCDHCKEAKEFLRSMGLSFRHFQVDTLPKNEIIRIKQEIEPSAKKPILYPVLRIGRRFLYGFDQILWELELSQSVKVS